MVRRRARGERLHGAGTAAKVVVTLLAGMFGSSAALQLAADEDPEAWLSAPGAVCIGCALLIVWTSRVGAWVSDSSVVFRSFWRTMTFDRAGIRVAVEPYASIWTWGLDSWFFTMLVVYRGNRRIPLGYTVGLRGASRRRAAAINVESLPGRDNAFVGRRARRAAAAADRSDGTDRR